MNQAQNRVEQYMAPDASEAWKSGRWKGRVIVASLASFLKNENEKSGPVSVATIDAYCATVSGSCKTKTEPKPERKQSLTADAFEYITEKADGRFPYRMYLNVDLTDVVKTLALTIGKNDVPPLTLDEVQGLVHADGEDLEICKACGKEHRKVASVQLWVPNLDDADVRMDVVAEGKKYFGEVDEDISKAYGRLAPFVKTFEHDGRVYPIVSGSIVPVPDGNGGWEKMSFCGPLFWHDHERGRIYPNNSSCVVKAAQGVETQGWGKARSFSSDSADLVIDRRTANHQKAEDSRKTREESNSKIDANLAQLFEERGSWPRNRRPRR